MEDAAERSSANEPLGLDENRPRALGVLSTLERTLREAHELARTPLTDLFIMGPLLKILV